MIKLLSPLRKSANVIGKNGEFYFAETIPTI